MRINLYSQNRHRLLIDGLGITQFAEGDWLGVKVDGGCINRNPAADGPHLTYVPEQGGRLTISVMPTSRALGDLYGIRKDVQKNPRLFSVSLMTGVDEIITAEGCGFGDMPEFQSGGETMAPRQFVIECWKINLDDSAVKMVDGGMVGGLIPINL